jgi:hypothetical protein
MYISLKQYSILSVYIIEQREEKRMRPYISWYSAVIFRKMILGTHLFYKNSYNFFNKGTSASKIFN